MVQEVRRVIACLWSGARDLPKYSEGRYGLNYVEALHRGVKRHVTDGELLVIADDEFIPGIEAMGAKALPFTGLDKGGWTKMLDAFQPDLFTDDTKRHVAVGLDTVLTGNCDWLFAWDRAPVGLPLDPYTNRAVSNAAVSFDRRGAKCVWDAFLESRKTNMRKDYYGGFPSEMALLRRLYAMHRWPVLEGTHKKLLSYKVHRNLRSATAVYFHGHLKPTDLAKTDPIRMAWDG